MKNTSDIDSKLAELKEATRRANEVLRDIKEERKLLQVDKKSLEMMRDLVDVKMKEVGEFILKEVEGIMIKALAGSVDAAREAMDQATVQMEGTVRGFKAAKDKILERAERDFDTELGALRHLIRAVENGKLELVVGTDDDVASGVPSTFANKGGKS
ncbi:hypothetical protein GCM10010423_64960 [Streptomyces levis]|uniref:Uncharacterized protein n=1 Tax=Streptomyces levis TaxID=285566 RepID=A0ABN3P0S3_9ACTN